MQHVGFTLDVPGIAGILEGLVVVMTDADWTGDVKDRRSYSGISFWVKSSVENTWYPVCASSKKRNMGVHQMTHFRDEKVFKNLATDEIDDHRTQSDHKWTTKIQKERTLHLVMRGETEHDTNDNVTTKTQSTFHIARMNINT